MRVAKLVNEKRLTTTRNRQLSPWRRDRERVENQNKAVKNGIGNGFSGWVKGTQTTLNLRERFERVKRRKMEETDKQEQAPLLKPTTTIIDIF